MTHELPFSPIPLISHLPTACIASLPASKLLKADVNAISEADPTWLPAYSPNLHFTMQLPQPPVLASAHKTPLRLILHTPPELLRGEGLYLHSLTVHLRSTVTARVSVIHQRSVKSRHLWSSWGVVRVDGEHFEVDSGTWGARVGWGTMPNFRSCVVELAHSLRVVVGLSMGAGGPIQCAQASLDVIVVDPPPGYEEG